MDADTAEGPLISASRDEVVQALKEMKTEMLLDHQQIFCSGSRDVSDG